MTKSLVDNVSRPSTSSIVDPVWESLDPTPDVRSLFLQFNITYFYSALTAVEVKWSSRMTQCAGICSYEGRGGLCSIRLSQPLLKFRPRSDLVETLLHEMIHAYLFVTQNNRDRDGHGPNFKQHMHRINREAGTNITIYHTFYHEVNNYKVHWWRCTGSCQSRHPFYGYVKRSMNRAPGPNDLWWSDHSRSCSGSFVKIREPEKKAKPPADKNKKPGKRKQEAISGDSTDDIRKFLQLQSTPGVDSVDDAKTLPLNYKDIGSKASPSSNPTDDRQPIQQSSTSSSFPFPIGGGQRLGGSLPHSQSRLLTMFASSSSHQPTMMSSPSSSSCNLVLPVKSFSSVTCPVCSTLMDESDINVHLDKCLIV